MKTFKNIDLEDPNFRASTVCRHNVALMERCKSCEEELEDYLLDQKKNETIQPEHQAIKGLCEIRLKLTECRDDLRKQGMWVKFDEIWKQYTDEIKSIDAKIDQLNQHTTKN
jgi:hypothetical protein